MWPVIATGVGLALSRVAPSAVAAVTRYAPRMSAWLHADAAVGGANTIAAVDTAHEAKGLAEEVGGLASDVAKSATGSQREPGPGGTDEKAVRIAAAMDDKGGRGTGKGIER